jgi:uncharacterized membrane protein YgcG
MVLSKYFRFSVAWGLAAVVLGVCSAPGFGQEEPDRVPTLTPIPPAPASQILDDGRVFNPDELQELSTYLKSIGAVHGIQIYVAIFSFCANETVEERAHRLRRNWANNDTGVIVVYERGSSALSFVATDEVDALMTRYDINRILETAGRRAQAEEGANRQVHVAVTTLADSLVESIARRRAANALVSKKRNLLIAATLAAIVLSGLIGLVIARMIRAADRRAAEFYYFPPVRVGVRYGGTFTGGAHAEMPFSKSPAQSS